MVKNKELILHPNIKINSFVKMRKLIGKKNINAIRVNFRQYDEYYFMLWGRKPENYNMRLTLIGIPLYFHIKLFKGFDALKAVEKQNKEYANK